MIPELEEIKRMLRREWDPIEVGGFEEAADEYDAYAFQVFTSLHQGATVAALSEYLDRVETEHMGLATTSGRSDAVARKIFAMHEGRTES